MIFLNNNFKSYGIFIVLNVKNASQLTYYGLHSLQHRGENFCEILSFNNGNFFKENGLNLINKVFTEEKIEKLKGNISFGYIEENIPKIKCTNKKISPPLFVGKLKNGYIFTSEILALKNINAQYIGETKRKICSLEYIFLSKPQNIIANRSIYDCRKKCGEALGYETLDFTKGDIVIGIPEFSLISAIGYASVIKIPYALGIIKNSYTKNSDPPFLKFSVIKNVIKDKRIILVINLILDIEEMKYIVNLLKKSGAKEIHIRVASSPMKILPQNLNVLLGSDSLFFLSYIKMKEVLGEDICFSCFIKNHKKNTPVN